MWVSGWKKDEKEKRPSMQNVVVVTVMMYKHRRGVLCTPTDCCHTGSLQEEEVPLGVETVSGCAV